MQVGRGLSALLAAALVAGGCIVLGLLAAPARSQPGFQSERLMTWGRAEAKDEVTYASAFSVARDGSVYVATPGRVKKFAPEGGFLLATQPELDRVSRFAVDSKGCIYVVHGGGLALISKFNARGVLLSDDPMEAEGRGGFGSERLAFDSNGSLVAGEVLSFADRVAVECVKYRIPVFFDAITVDNKDRLHVLIDDRNPYAAGSAIFDTDGYLVGVGPGGTEAIRFDRAGRKYVFRPTGDWGQTAALTMYSPTEVVLPGPLKLPVDKIVLPRPNTENLPDDANPLHGWSVDDSGNFYCYTLGKRELPTEVRPGEVIHSDLYVFKLDPAGHVLAQTPALPDSPEDITHYEPQIDGAGRVYYLDFYSDRIEVMRGTFSP